MTDRISPTIHARPCRKSRGAHRFAWGTCVPFREPLTTKRLIAAATRLFFVLQITANKSSSRARWQVEQVARSCPRSSACCRPFDPRGGSAASVGSAASAVAMRSLGLPGCREQSAAVRRLRPRDGRRLNQNAPPQAQPSCRTVQPATRSKRRVCNTSNERTADRRPVNACSRPRILPAAASGTSRSIARAPTSGAPDNRVACRCRRSRRSGDQGLSTTGEALSSPLGSSTAMICRNSRERSRPTNDG